MTKYRASQLAHKQARQSDESRFVMFEDGEYHVACEFDLDTWWLGQDPEFVVNPDGTIE